MRTVTAAKTLDEKFAYHMRAYERLRLEHNIRADQARKTGGLESFVRWQREECEPRIASALASADKYRETLVRNAAEIQQRAERRELAKADVSWDTFITNPMAINKMGRLYDTVDPYQNFSLFTEHDGESAISVAPLEITYTSLDRDEKDRVIRDYGADYFDGDFEHLVEVEVTSSSTGAFVFHWMLSQDDDAWKSIMDESGNILSGHAYKPASNMSLSIAEINGGTQYQDDSTGRSLNTPYYLKYKRDETVGTYGTFYCYIYDDSARTNLVDTTALALHSSKKDFRYLSALNTYDTGDTSIVQTGYIRKLDIGGSGDPFGNPWYYYAHQ